jgi:hypothetical protein
MITREWGLDPTPGELRTIVEVGHDPAGESGRLRELARATLATRVFVEHHVRQLLDARQLDAERVRETVGRLPEFSEAVDELDVQLRSIEETLAPAEREFLRGVGRTLAPVRDDLVAAWVIAPSLRQLARARGEEEIRAALPTLTDDEVAMLGSVVRPPGGEDPGRFCVNAVLLSAVMRADLALRTPAEEPAATPEENSGEVGDGVSVDDRESWARLARDKIAYHVIAGQLQRQQDTALMAGLTDHAEMVRHTQQSLFATYRELAATLNAGAGELAGPGMADGPDLRRLLEESAAQDALADVQLSQRVSEEELYLDALKGAGPVEVRPASVFTPAYDPGRERLRIRVLSSIAAVLFAACLSVWTMRLGDGSDPSAVPLDEVSDKLILDQAVSVGPMMYAVVSHWSWQDMSEEERLASVRALGLSAANEGYESVYLVDEAHEELAMWSKSDGAKLMGPEASERPDRAS